jgi:signal transduction histidine kinase
MALNYKPIIIADLLNAAKQMTAEWARQQSLEIIIECPTELGSFEADENRMKQTLFNLVSNAIKYTPAGGRITLEARREQDWVKLSVIDTGIGIPENDRVRVFGKFERTNPQARQTGAGLGLSLVKSFIELHHGRIEISGNGEHGTRVSCYLPVKATKVDEMAKSA